MISIPAACTRSDQTTATEGQLCVGVHACIPAHAAPGILPGCRRPYGWQHDSARTACLVPSTRGELNVSYLLPVANLATPATHPENPRGLPYLQQVGMIAINDSFLLEGCVYRLLRKYLSDDPAYVPLLELFHDTTHRTVFGQLLDLTTAPAGPIDLERCVWTAHGGRGRHARAEQLCRLSGTMMLSLRLLWSLVLEECALTPLLSPVHRPFCA
eukprot:361840-Chlamydomonas_euryale.AAC.9